MGNQDIDQKNHAGLYACYLAGLLAVSGIVSAQPEPEDIPLLEPVTVTAQGLRADTVTVVNRRQIGNQHSAVAFDVLETQPGLHVVRRLGLTGSGLSRLTIRGNGGVGPAGIQVFVDGRPDATVSFAHPTPSALSLENVERIEVIHGPSPVLHGSGKTGVVNIVTAAPAAGLHGFVKGSYGSFDTSENFARLSYGGERGYMRVSGSYRTSDGSNPDADAYIRSLNFKGGVQFNERVDATFTVGQNVDSFDVFGSFSVPGPFTDPRTDSLNLTQTVYDFTLNAKTNGLESSLKLFYDDLDPRSQILDGSEERATVFERGVRLKTEWAAWADTRFIGGIDYVHAQANNSPVLPPFGGPMLATPRPRVEESLEELGVYAFASHALNQSVSLSGGIRHTSHSDFDSELSGELGVLWTPAVSSISHPIYGTTFRARVTRGFQSPTLQQLYGVFRGGQAGPANPNLEPEILNQYEIGFNKTFSKGNFDLVVYVQQGEDLIELPATPPPPPPDIQNNIDFANRGIEARLHFSPAESWQTMLGVTLADFEQNNDRFLRVPETTVDFGITYTYRILKANDLSISLLGRYANEAFDVPASPANSPRVELDDYFVADLQLNYQVNNSTRVFLEIDNTTDEDYELVAGIPAPSVGVYAGISLDF